MDFTIGSLELNRTNPAHLGTKPVIDTAKKLYMDSFGNVSDAAPKEQIKRGDFENAMLEAAREMNAQQVNVAKLQEQIITDPDSVDIHDVTTAMAKAKMSLNLAQTVIDRLITGWNELSQNR